MPVEYRALRKNEEEAVIRLWVEVLEDDWEMRARVFRDFVDEPKRFARTHIAIAADGTILSAASYWLRALRALDGTSCRAGHLWGVATRPEARRQGHATKLLDLAVQSMQDEGCLWSILFAREEARTLYARLGWHDIPSHYRSAILTGQQIETDSAYLIRAIDPQQEAQGWARLAAIYAEANAQRPLTMIRTHSYWQGYAAWMLADWMQNHCALLFVAAPTTDPNDWRGYVVAHFYNASYAEQNFGSPPWFYVSEIATRTKDSEATAVLLRAVAQEASQREMGYGQMTLPREAGLNETLQELFGASLREHEGDNPMMIRALGPTAPKRPSLDATDAGFFWGLDQF